MYDCDGLGFCNNEPGFGFDCYVYNEYCEDFNGDGITDSWVGDGWCDDGEWGYDFQCTEYSFDCGDCGDNYTDYNGYCSIYHKNLHLYMKKRLVSISCIFLNH